MGRELNWTPLDRPAGRSAVHGHPRRRACASRLVRLGIAGSDGFSRWRGQNPQLSERCKPSCGAWKVARSPTATSGVRDLRLAALEGLDPRR